MLSSSNTEETALLLRRLMLLSVANLFSYKAILDHLLDALFFAIIGTIHPKTIGLTLIEQF
jgi:hypothetical protein